MEGLNLVLSGLDVTIYKPINITSLPTPTPTPMGMSSLTAAWRLFKFDRGYETITRKLAHRIEATDGMAYTSLFLGRPLAMSAPQP